MSQTANIIAPIALNEVKLGALADQMGVSRDDARSFLSAVGFWMAKGLSFDQAVEKHMQIMREGCALMLAR